MTNKIETLTARGPAPFSTAWYRQRDGKDPFEPDTAMGYCSVHQANVPEAELRPLEPGSRYSICTACDAKRDARLNERVSYCSECLYLLSFHLNGECPSEAEARSASGSH
jgi:hypothetical protein